jgi:hypothetical protein
MVLGSCVEGGWRRCYRPPLNEGGDSHRPAAGICGGDSNVSHCGDRRAVRFVAKALEPAKPPFCSAVMSVVSGSQKPIVSLPLGHLRVSLPGCRSYRLPHLRSSPAQVRSPLLDFRSHRVSMTRESASVGSFSLRTNRDLERTVSLRVESLTCIVSHWLYFR